MKDKLLIIFTKNPVLGRVKTRLAKNLGDEEALAIFKKLLKISAQTALTWGGEVWVLYSDFLPEKDIWSSVANRIFLQEGEGLGERMANAFSKGLEKKKHVLLIGTDIPEMSNEIIDVAFDALLKNDFVLGPTLDGGYYLIGMKKKSPFVFQNIVWSTPNVLRNTINKMQTKNAKFELLPILQDIDYEADLQDFPSLRTIS